MPYCTPLAWKLDNLYYHNEDEIINPPNESENNPGFKTSTPQSPTRKVNLFMANQINGQSINGNSPTTKSADDIPVKSKYLHIF